MSARLLVNPGGGRGRTGRHLAELRRLAARHGLPVELSRDAADLTARARRAAADGLERLLVAGGDGTLHHALQGLTGTGCALGIVPLGSGNDLAGALGVPAAPAAAIAAGLERPVSAIDLGRAGGRFFAGVAGVGFDSEVNRCANERVRWVRGPLVYVVAVLRTLWGFRPPRFRVRWDGGAFDGPAMFVAVANAPRYGGGMRIAPAARLDDGRLDLVLVRAVSRLALLRVFPRVFRGSHVDHPAVLVARAGRVEIAVEPPLELFADGEPAAPVGSEPLAIEIAPLALRVVAGRV